MTDVESQAFARVEAKVERVEVKVDDILDLLRGDRAYPPDTPEGRGVVGRLCDVEARAHSHKGTIDRLWQLVLGITGGVVGWFLGRS